MKGKNGIVPIIPPFEKKRKEKFDDWGGEC